MRLSAVLFGLVTLALHAANAQTDRRAPPFVQKRRVCITDVKPLSYCDNSTDSTKYTGFSVELFRKLATYNNLTENVDYYFDCVRSSYQKQSLKDPNGTCWSVATGLEIRQENLAEIQYTWPIGRQGLRILIHYDEPQDIWFIFSAFELEVWLAMLGTAFATGIVVWALEECSGKLWVPLEEDSDDEQDDSGLHGEPTVAPKKRTLFKRFMKRAHGVDSDGCYNITWGHVGNLVAVASAAPKYMGPRLVFYAFGFMVLIMITLYTASTAAALTNARLDIKINSLDDLRGKSVITDTDYVDELTKLELVVQALPWEDSADDQTFLNLIVSEQKDAIILDDTWVRYWDAQFCALYAVGPRFNTRNVAFAFSMDTPTSLVDLFSKSILELQKET
eukprot:gene31620-6814_t